MAGRALEGGDRQCVREVRRGIVVSIHVVVNWLLMAGKLDVPIGQCSCVQMPLLTTCHWLTTLVVAGGRRGTQRQRPGEGTNSVSTAAALSVRGYTRATTNKKSDTRNRVRQSAEEL